MKKILIGTSGYNYKDWKERFYPQDLPQKDWLNFYANHFNTVEINATFYRSFPKSVFDKWRKITPNDFCFSIKGPRFITHIKRLHEVKKSVNESFDALKGLDKKLSVVLWQFPASFRWNEDSEKRMINFLELLPKNIRQTFEFRNESWFNQDLYQLLNEFNAGFVINDTSSFPNKEIVTGDFAYIRFHGPENLYLSKYSINELKTWAKKIRVYKRKYDVYTYFNNDTQGFAIENALELKKLLNV